LGEFYFRPNTWFKCKKKYKFLLIKKKIYIYIYIAML